jgi:hypothetical protein
VIILCRHLTVSGGSYLKCGREERGGKCEREKRRTWRGGRVDGGREIKKGKGEAKKGKGGYGKWRTVFHDMG